MYKLDLNTLNIVGIQTNSGTYDDGGNIKQYVDYCIHWAANTGFGTYTISVSNDGRITGDSEFMDTNKDKSFLKALFDKIIDAVEII